MTNIICYDCGKLNRLSTMGPAKINPRGPKTKWVPKIIFCFIMSLTASTSLEQFSRLFSLYF